MRKWLVGIAVATLLAIAGLLATATIAARRVGPYLRAQAIEYLSERFESDVELAALRVHLPDTSPVRLLLRGGRGELARVEGEGLVLRHKGRRDVPPMLAVNRLRFDVDLGTLFDTAMVIPSVVIEGLEINIPPKGERPPPGGSPSEKNVSESRTGVVIREVVVRDARLVILPRERTKVPLEFAIRALRLHPEGSGVTMRYDAAITNPRPPGAIHSVGSFGPWNADEPGDTPLSGNYTLEKADLGVFPAIAGILDSTGRFDGTLDSIRAKGQASVPDFRLKLAGNPVPLVTQFEALIDGTNGNTILQPVRAALGTTAFTTSGGVIRHEPDSRRTISLDASMPQGNLRDLIRLAVKGTPFMEGQITLQTKVDIPPLMGTTREKLTLDGRFEVRRGRFLRAAAQDKVDSLSRRGQGKPGSDEIEDVVSGMKGSFTLENEVLRFRSLSFGVPGANVDLKGSYDLRKDALDFHGTLKLQARVSETMTGWKRWVLKPLDPLFAKDNAGTFLRIRVTGSSRAPKFGASRGSKGPSSR
jgi:hypothetical protein